jgi:hypothetical protein
VGPVRQRQLIRLSSVLVALNLAAGLTVVYAHATGAADRQPRARVVAGAPPATGTATTAGSAGASGGALAAGHFSNRRGSDTTSSTTAAGPGPTSPAATAPAPAVTGSSAPVVTTGPPATTATTRGPGAATPTTSPDETTTTAGKTPAAGSTPGSGEVTDPAGDTFVDGTSKRVTEARADIVAAGAAFGPGGVTFTVQVRQPDDPRTDPKWSSDATFITFDVDTTGDGKPDFEVQYGYDGTQFTGQVTHPGDDDSVPALCNATTAGYGAAGYSVTIDPACLGNPTSLAFRVTTYYDTNPKDDNADVASDVAPDGGMSFPVTRPS